MSSRARRISAWQRFRARLSEDRHLLFDRPAFTLRPLSYDDYWEARGGVSDSQTLSIWQLYRVDRVIPHLVEGDVVLDLGCGGSGTLNAIRSRAPIRGIGADISSAALEKLRKAKGEEFDRAYMSQMVKDHEKALKTVQQAAKNAKDPELKQMAQKAEPDIEKHLQMAKQLSDSASAGGSSGKSSSSTGSKSK